MTSKAVRRGRAAQRGGRRCSARIRQHQVSGTERVKEGKQNGGVRNLHMELINVLTVAETRRFDEIESAAVLLGFGVTELEQGRRCVNLSGKRKG